MAETVTLSIEDLLAERGWLVSLSRHLVLDASEAEDIAHETLIRALRQSDAAPPGRLRAWLAGTARNVAFERYRQSSRRSHREEEVAVPEDDGSVTPEDAVARVEFRAQLAHLVVGLPEDERTAIALRYFEGLKTAAIAERTGVHAGTVRQRISRGVAKLRAELNQGNTAGQGGAGRWLTVATGIANSGTERTTTVGAAGAGAVSAVIWGTGALVMAASALWLAGVFQASDPPQTAPSPSGKETASTSPRVAPGTAASTATAAPTPVPTATRISAETPWASTPGRAWVQIVDEITGVPADGVSWILSPTGDKDTGGVVVFSNETENPAPYAFGTTGPNGIAEFAPPGDELVHFITHRSETYARASHALRLDADQALPQKVTVHAGTTVTGRVVNDLGHPCEGILIGITDRDYEFQYAASTDRNGRFEVPRVADFPRRFKKDEAGDIAAMDTEDCCLSFAWPLDWTPNPSSDIHPVAAYRRVLIGERPGPRFELDDVVLPRPKRILGRVTDAEGRPEAGALVTLNPRFRFSIRGRGQAGLKAEFPWEPGGEFMERELLTDEKGEFEALLTFEPSRLQSIGAINRYNSKVTVKLPPLAPGETSERLTLQLPDAGALGLQLKDAADPGGKLDWFRSLSPHLVRLTVHTPAGETPTGPSTSLLTVTKSGVVYVLASALGRLPAKATLSVSGFEPMELDITSASGTMECTLVRKPLIEVEVHVLGKTTTPWVMLKLSPFPPTRPVIGGRIQAGSRSLGSRPGAFFMERAPVNATTTMPDPGGESLWLYAQLQHGVDERAYPAEVRGPFRRGIKNVQITMEADQGAPALDPPGAGQPKPRPRTTVLVHAKSNVTGDPVEEAVLRCTSDRVRGGFREAGRLEVYVSAEVASFTVEAVGYRPISYGPLSLGEGGTLDLGDARLEPLPALGGQLLTAMGDPLRASRRVRYEDAELGWLTVLSDEAGKFSLWTTGAVPTHCYVQGPEPSWWVGSGQLHGRSEAQVPLMETRPKGGVTAQLPGWINVEIEVAGIGTDAKFGVGEVVAIDGDGQIVRLGHLGVRSGRSLFGAALPPGTWTLRGGKRISIEPQSFHLEPEPRPKGPPGPVPAPIPVVIQAAGTIH